MQLEQAVDLIAGLPGREGFAVDEPSEEQIAVYYPRLFRTALRMTGDREAAADLTQQAFCQALRRWHQFKGKGLRTTWLHRILVNCVRDKIRRKGVEVSQPLDEWATSAVADPPENSTEKQERQERLAYLREVIQKLPDTFRSAFVVTVLDGHTYEEAADLLSVPLGTIASRVGSARRLLTQAMRERFPETDS